MFGSSVPSVSPRDVANLTDDWMLLDVRSDGESAQGRIAGSVHIPMDQLLTRMDEVGDHVVCVCAVGSRSGRVTQYLIAHGYQALNLEGGIYAWAEAGLPLER